MVLKKTANFAYFVPLTILTAYSFSTSFSLASKTKPKPPSPSFLITSKSVRNLKTLTKLFRDEDKRNESS